MDAASARTVVVDASVLINLIHLERLDLLAKLEGFEFAVPEQAKAEVSDPAQAAGLSRAIEAGWLRNETSTETKEIALYAELVAVMGRGEAACLAMAEGRGWLVGCDEGGRFRREALARVGQDRLVNTPGLFVLAIRRGLLTVEQADRIKDLLAQQRYVMPFASFRDLLH